MKSNRSHNSFLLLFFPSPSSFISIYHLIMSNYTTLNRPLGAGAPSMPPEPAAYPFEISVAGEQSEADLNPTPTRGLSGSFSNPIEIDFDSPSLPDSSTCLLYHGRAGDSIDNPIEIEDDDSESSTDGLLTQLTRAGDTIDHPVCIDNGSTETASDNGARHSEYGSGLEPLSDIRKSPSTSFGTYALINPSF
ncbi:hypothetical protein CBS63078_10208 [Aspergillus niger]|nr:hypothetical protein CBS63078_10208 [Aspergillus niger]